NGPNNPLPGLAKIVVETGATLSATGDGGIYDARPYNWFGGGYVGQAPLLQNRGTFRKTRGSSATAIYVPLDSSGTIDVQTGTVAINADSTISGAVTVAATAIFQVNGGTSTLTSTGSITGAGTLATTGGSLTTSGPINVGTYVLVYG